MAIPGLAAVSGFSSLKSGITGAVKGLLGGAPPDRNASLRLRAIFRAAMAGDPTARLQLETMARNQGSKFPNINRKAVKYWALVSGATVPMKGAAPWPVGAGPVPEDADEPSVLPPPRPTTRPSAPSAPRPKPPCAYGPRDPQTGLCPKRPRATTAAGFRGGSTERPCKYGPRDEFGRCPKKPTGARRRGTTGIPRAVERRLTTAGGNLAVKVAPVVARFAARWALPLTVGLAAYAITSKLRTLRFKTVDEIKYEAANAYREMRRARMAELGRALTPSEQSDLARWFKGRMQELDSLGRTRTSVRDLTKLTFGD